MVGRDDTLASSNRGNRPPTHGEQPRSALSGSAAVGAVPDSSGTQSRQISRERHALIGCELRLDEFLAQAATKRQEAAEGRPVEDTGAAVEREAGRTEFLAWRETLGLPTLSAVAERLRAAGEQARIVVRSSPGSVGADASELVELRFRLRRENAFFSPDGHVRISWTSYRGLELDIAPMANSSATSASYSPPFAAPPKLEGLTQDHLEKQVLEAVRRATAGR